MVRCADKATAEKVNAKAIPSLVFYDGDGQEFLQKAVTNGEGIENAALSIEAAMKEALEKYAPKPVSWASGEVAGVLEQGASEKKPVVLVFVDDKESSKEFLESLNDRWIVKHHDKAIFVQAPYDRESDLCKEWRVGQAPTALLVNASAERPSDRVVEKCTQSKVANVKSLFLKGLPKFQKALLK